MVGAVIRHDVDIKKRLRVILPQKALYQFPDDPLFVARGNHTGKARFWICPRNRLWFFQRKQRHNQKIGAHQLQRQHRPGNHLLHGISLVSLFFYSITIRTVEVLNPALNSAVDFFKICLTRSEQGAIITTGRAGGLH